VLINGVVPKQHGKYAFQDFFLNAGGTNSSRFSSGLVGTEPGSGGRCTK
jgi:hypothetical protein